MDQENTKPGPGDVKGSWRDRLGIGKELPKISDEFKNPPQASAPGERREPGIDKAGPLPRPGVPVAKPAPMAPRANAAELGDRLRKQREAAERMAEQRVAEAKERALQEPRQPPPPTSGEGSTSSAPPRPRFTFADLPPKPEQPQTSEPVQRRWRATQGPAVGSARPVFTADRQGSQNDPRVRGPSPPPRQTGAAMPPTHARSQPPPQRAAPPPHSQPLPPPAAGHWQAPRPLRQPPPAYDSHRRDISTEAARQLDDPYAQEDQYNRPARPQEPLRARDMDFRSAHSRELDYVEEESEGLFEEEQAYAGEPRRRATAQEYNQAYREYEGAEDEGRRRTGPFLLIAALIAVGAIAGGLIYFYQKSTFANQAAGEGNVPVVDEPSEPVKTEPKATAAAEEEVPETQQQSSVMHSGELPAPVQKKQIYDRILGETTLEEQEQVVPSEEQPVAPEGEIQGFDADPLPLPPPPGGSSEDQSGSLELQGPSPVTAASTKSAAENISTQASPAAASLESEPAPAISPPSVSPPEATQPVVQPEAPKPEPKAVTAEQKIDSELAFAEKPAGKAAPASTGSGPVQIAQLPFSETSAAANPVGPPDVAVQTDQPKVLPDVVKRRSLSGRASEKIVSSANTNFNKAKAVEVAAVEEAPITTQSLPPESVTAPVAETQPPPQQQAAVQPSTQEPAQTQLSHGTGTGFVIQLASYKSEVEALAGFEQLRQRHGTLIGSLTPSVVKADLGTNGTFYRLHLGAFSSKQAAKTACTNLLAAGERDCLVKAR